MTKISDAVCRKVLRKFWYPPTATMNFLRKPSTHFPLLNSNSYDGMLNKKSLLVLWYQGYGQGDITSPVLIPVFFVIYK